MAGTCTGTQRLRVESAAHDTAAQVVRLDAAENGRIDDLGRGRGDHHLLLFFRHIGFTGGDEARAHVAEIRAHHFRSPQCATVGKCAGEHDGSVPELAHFGQQGEWRQGAGMAACAGADQDQPVDAALQRLARVLHRDDIVEHQPAIAMHLRAYAIRLADRGDHQRHAMAGDQREILVEAPVRGVQDQVDAERRDPLCGVSRCVGGELVFDARDPLLEGVERAGVQ